MLKKNMVIYTPEGVELYVRTALGLEDQLECGTEALEMITRKVNSNFVTLEGLVECIKIDGRIIERCPIEMQSGKVIAPHVETRFGWLKRAKARLMDKREKGSRENILIRLVEIERAIEELQKGMFDGR